MQKERVNRSNEFFIYSSFLVDPHYFQSLNQIVFLILKCIYFSHLELIQYGLSTISHLFQIFLHNNVNLLTLVRIMRNIPKHFVKIDVAWSLAYICYDWKLYLYYGIERHDIWVSLTRGASILCYFVCAIVYSV